MVQIMYLCIKYLKASSFFVYYLIFELFTKSGPSLDESSLDGEAVVRVHRDCSEGQQDNQVRKLIVPPQAIMSHSPCMTLSPV